MSELPSRPPSRPLRAHAAPHASRAAAHQADDRSRGDVPWRSRSPCCPPMSWWGRSPGWSGSGSGPRRPRSSSSTSPTTSTTAPCGGSSTGTGLYVLVGGARRAPWSRSSWRAHPPTRAGHLLAVVGSGCDRRSADVEGRGTHLGPPDPKAIAAATAADGTLLPDNLAGARRSPFLIWPMTSLFVLALVFFAWPGRPAGDGPAPGRETRRDPLTGPATRPKRGFRKPPSRGRLPPQRAESRGRSTTGSPRMSDHQPTGGTPEYLESGDAAAVLPTPRTPTRRTPAPEPSYDVVGRRGRRRPGCSAPARRLR